MDYGWGSDQGGAFPSYLELDTTAIGDDGGYLIMIRGDFPRLGASPRQRPTGFSLVLDNGTEYLCYSGRAGDGVRCSTDLRAQILSGYSPALDVGDYSVLVRWGNTEQDVGTVSVERRMRTTHEYYLRDAYPSAYAVGARRLEIETILDGNAPSARNETRTNLDHLTRALGQSIAEFSASGVVTRVTQDLTPTDSTLHVESTLGMSATGGVYVGGILCTYQGRTETSLTGLNRVYGQVYTIPRGEVVHHDPHTIAD